jgi:5'-methylthioadenosine phosphorylase
MNHDTPRIGIIGGSGLYTMDALTERAEGTVATPFGDVPVLQGRLAGRPVAFVPRHGEGHRYNPSEVNYRGNIYALKLLGIRFVFAVSACGSLRARIRPGDLVVPTQLVDFTKGRRASSFFEGGLVAHVGTADPFCPKLSDIACRAAQAVECRVHRGGTFITIEGPRFSTRGESSLFRSWGMDIIGMTTAPEAFLAREAEMSYTVMAHVTDYDVWHDEPVSNDIVVKTFGENLERALTVLERAVALVDLDAVYPAHDALRDAIMSRRDAISPSARKDLAPIVRRYLSDSPPDSAARSF